MCPSHKLFPWSLWIKSKESVKTSKKQSLFFTKRITEILDLSVKKREGFLIWKKKGIKNYPNLIEENMVGIL